MIKRTLQQIKDEVERRGMTVVHKDDISRWAIVFLLEDLVEAYSLSK